MDNKKLLKVRINKIQQIIDQIDQLFNCSLGDDCYLSSDLENAAIELEIISGRLKKHADDLKEPLNWCKKLVKKTIKEIDNDPYRQNLH